MNLRDFAHWKHRRFCCLMVLLWLLILIRYAFQVDIPRIVLLGVIAVTAILGDRNEIIAECIAFIPMHESIDLYYALVICMAVYVLKYHRELRFGFGLFLVFAAAVWEMLHCFQWASSFSIIEYLVYIIPFAVIVILMSGDTADLEYSFIVRVFCWSTFGIILAMLIRILYFSGFDIAASLNGLQRLGSDEHSGIEGAAVSGGQIHPNSLGIITVLASSGLMQLRQGNLGKKSDMFLMCGMLLIAALSASRTYLVCLAMMFLLLIFAQKGGIAKKMQLISLLILVGAGVVTAMAILFPSTFAFFISRFFVEDITTGRGGLMVDYHKFIFSDPVNLFFGIGLQDYGYRLTEVYRIGNVVPHNFIQEIVIAWGVMGLIIFGMLFFIMHRASSQQNRCKTLMNWIPLIIILVKSIAGQLLTSSYTMLALSFAYLSLCQDFSSQDGSEEPK